MIWGAIGLFLTAFVVSLAGTWLAKRYALRLGLMDAPGHRKVHTVATPRNGGIGIFWGFALPLVAGLVAVCVLSAMSVGKPVSGESWGKGGGVAKYLPGMRTHVPLAVLFLVGTLAMHLLGLLDDRKAMAAWPKLLAQLAIAGALVGCGEWLGAGSFRVLTFLGPFPGWGFWVSAIASICWIVALTNAFNFLDNMDGLSAGIAFICAAMFLIAAAFNGQWFICSLLLLFMGSVLGFLCFNFPPASIFMGDGGSMVLGFILSVLTIRTTYYDTGRAGGGWYAVLMPVFVMIVPLYDLTIVSVLRVWKGRSPMQGDTNHFSHRLTRHGFSKRGAVLVIYAVTLATGVTAPLLARVDDVSAMLLAVQLAGMVVVIGLLERVGEHTT
jgi:UDP-GlcNAc:undecaprenyl-phosphate GlcNAc-1-phosphate transferase